MVVQKVYDTSPAFLFLNLEGRGARTRSLSQSRAYFDYNNDGKRTPTGWPESGQAIVYFDKNNDGKMSGASELLRAESSLSHVRGKLTPLIIFDNNRDGIVDARDPKFSRLKLWRDFDKDGAFDADEGFTLKDRGISGLRVTAKAYEGKDGPWIELASGARLLFKGGYVRSKPTRLHAAGMQSSNGLYLGQFETELTRHKDAQGNVVHTGKPIPAPKTKRRNDRVPARYGPISIDIIDPETKTAEAPPLRLRKTP